ncbi:unnamed protein product [Sphenostylis stenocarpa]|uniref:Calcineurin B-like protein n=1 Tax=Sphenostylis stenocarpa TaxID=92480 RepID=A0AA86SEL2_9FABA|nr:unnamed protein product [Sphenostylis stenocarpa]
MSCFGLKKARPKNKLELSTILASETSFTVNEIEALLCTFKKLSSAIIDDGVIHKAMLSVAYNLRNFIPVTRSEVFDMFDTKRDGVIGFGEFVRSLSIFHPNASEEKKIEFAFRLFDLRQSGYIERQGLKEMVLATLTESDLTVTDDVAEAIVDKTMKEVDSKGDGKIDNEEWRDYVTKNPSLLKIMTLPYLKDITMAFPSFILHSEVED